MFHLINFPVGKNDGSVHGIKYFECKCNHGLFVKANQTQLYLLQSQPRNDQKNPTSNMPELKKEEDIQTPTLFIGKDDRLKRKLEAKKLASEARQLEKQEKWQQALIIYHSGTNSKFCGYSIF